MDKQSAACPRDEMRFVLQRGGNSDTCYNGSEPEDSNKPDTQGEASSFFPAHEVPGIAKYVETERRIVLQDGGQGVSVYWGRGVTMGRRKRSVDGGGDDCTTCEGT